MLIWVLGSGHHQMNVFLIVLQGRAPLPDVYLRLPVLLPPDAPEQSRPHPRVQQGEPEFRGRARERDEEEVRNSENERSSPRAEEEKVRHEKEEPAGLAQRNPHYHSGPARFYIVSHIYP